MPYYRIIITLKSNKPIKGIKELPERDIERAHQALRHQYREHYGNNFEDIEVQMLSKSCTAVKQHLAIELKKKENEHFPTPNKPYTPSPNRKKTYSANQGWNKNQQTPSED